MEYAVTQSTFRGTDSLRWVLLALPIYVYVVVSWLIRPLSSGNIALAYAVPLSFSAGMLIFSVPRSHVVAMLGRLRIELALTLLMAALSILSVINSGDPFRILRILFPSILPVLLFVQLAALGALSPSTLERIPRLFLYSGLALGVFPLFLSFGSGALDRYFFEGGYRFMGFFEHEAQLSVMVAVLVPLVIGEIAASDARIRRWIWLAVLAIVFYTQVRIGSKTALFITIGYAWLFYLIAHMRVHSVVKNLMIFSVIVVLMTSLVLFGRDWVAAIDPVLGEKLDSLFSGGLENYRTIESRMEMWREAWRQGTAHWVIGAGAGQPIMGLQHAHNLVLEYFRGTGVFGALAIILLCVRILWRAWTKTVDVLIGQATSPHDIRVLACYTAGAVYVLCNQMSNSFGPATISALWLVYLPAVMAEVKPRRILRLDRS